MLPRNLNAIAVLERNLVASTLCVCGSGGTGGEKNESI